MGLLAIGEADLGFALGGGGGSRMIEWTLRVLLFFSLWHRGTGAQGDGRVLSNLMYLAGFFSL